LGEFIESTAQAVRGGFKGVESFRGLLVDLDRVANPWQSDGPDQVKATFKDAQVLTLFPGEEPFTFKNGEHSFYTEYNPKAHSIWMECMVASAEELGTKMFGKKMKPSEFKGQYVTMKKVARKLFDKPKLDENKKAIIGPDGKKVLEAVFAVDETGLPNHFSFVPDENADSSDVKDYIKKNLVGLSSQAALRFLITDAKVSRFTEYRDALKADSNTFAESVGLKFNGEQFVEGA